MTDFSVVLPMRGTEVRLLKKNLPSWCLLKPSEIILGLDKPAPLECIQEANRIALRCNRNLKIIEIERNTEYKMHQAWARRKCFREAKNDVIFTGDIDLYVYPACLKALNIIGQDNIGLVSLMKKRDVRSIGGVVKNFLDGRIKAHQRKRGLLEDGQQAYFTGLYCIYRPYWLDSEDEFSIKNMLHPYDAPLLMDSWGGYRGEDTHLHDHMKKKYKCVYLPDIGAEDQRPGLEDRKPIQTKIGMKFAYEGKHPITVFSNSLLNLRFHVFRSYVTQLKQMHGNSISAEVYRTIIAGFFPVGLRIVLNQEIELKSRVALKMQEFPVSVALAKLKGRIFVDVGSNRGYYPLLLRDNFEKIVCFEPAPSYDDLIKNITAFGVDSKIHAAKVAVSDSEGDDILHLAKYTQSNASIAAEQLVASPEVIYHIGGKLLGTETVKRISLAEFFRNEEFIDLIKVDVAGSEWQVLDGAIPIIERIRTWVVELYSPSRQGEMQEWFARYGYKTRLLSSSANTCHIMASR